VNVWTELSNVSLSSVTDMPPRKAEQLFWVRRWALWREQKEHQDNRDTQDVKDILATLALTERTEFLELPALLDTQR